MQRFFNSMLLVVSLSLATTAYAADNPKVKLASSHGDIIIELYPDKAPKTVKNFLDYVDSGFYDGTIFHRVIRNFMVQGGGFDKDYKKKPTSPPVPK